MNLGARYFHGECEFTVWAPQLSDVAVNLISQQRVIPLDRDPLGYWRGKITDVRPNSDYVFRLGESLERPDPASYFQPAGVHGPSRVIDHRRFDWSNDSHQLSLEDLVIYELHVGTFTAAGTFTAIIPRLTELRELGVTAIELMPVAQFPGGRNWGYDGVYPYAVQNSYGGPDDLKKFVRACHAQGVGVILDVVYNHLGPEGCYVRDFGPYYTDRYKTPWGDALNFDGAYGYGVREFFIQNALYWFRHFHVDALRLDATHAIYDTSAHHFLAELADRVRELSEEQGRKLYLIAESDANDPRLIRPKEQGGYGLAAQWGDEFHHSLRCLLTGEQTGYYADFGKLEDLAQSYRRGYVYTGQYSAHRKRFFGAPPDGCSAGQFVVFTQNHDQVGNRMLGERLSELVSFEQSKLAAGAMLLSPFVPLIFMGEEYGEENPFLYFVSHEDPNLQAAVREGRKAEFKAFDWQGEPPDPNDEQTFLASKLNWEARSKAHHRVTLDLYRRLLELRRTVPALRHLSWREMEVREQKGSVLLLRRYYGASEIVALLNFAGSEVECRLDVPEGEWKKKLDSASEEWRGPGSSSPERVASGGVIRLNPHSFVLFERAGLSSQEEV